MAPILSVNREARAKPHSWLAFVKAYGTNNVFMLEGIDFHRHQQLSDVVDCIAIVGFEDTLLIAEYVASYCVSLFELPRSIGPSDAISRRCRANRHLNAKIANHAATAS
jgi:hypothetical protein